MLLNKKLLIALLICLLPYKAFCYDPKAAQIKTDTTNFDNNLSSADTDVQKALETLDEAAGGGSMTYPGAGIAVSTGTAWTTSIAVDYFYPASNPNSYITLGDVPAETDPVYSGDPAYGIASGDITNWGTAYSHSQVTTGNPHSLDYADIGLTAGQVINWTLASQGTIAVTNLPDLSATYWTVGNAFIKLTDLSATNPIQYNSGTGAISWTNSEGYLTAEVDGSVTNEIEVVDDAYSIDWSIDTTHAASKKSLYDKIETLGAGLAEAPTDSQTYGRNNAAWTVVSGGIALTDLSATNPIVYNNTTGAISWTNSESYITQATWTSTGVTWAGNAIGNTKGGTAADTSGWTGLAKVSSGNWTTITDSSSNWNTAYGWGDHSTAGYWTTSVGQTWAGNDIALTTNTSGSYVASVATTAPLTGGAAGSEGATLTIAIPKADTSTNGYLWSTDWTAFNGKQAALGYTPAYQWTIAGTTGADLIGNTAEVWTITGGAASGHSTAESSNILTINQTKASTTVNGYLWSTDFTTFNDKQAALGFTPSYQWTAAADSGTAIRIGDSNETMTLNGTVAAGISTTVGSNAWTITQTRATTSANGYLWSTDFTTFNAKADAGQTFYIGTTQVAINRASAALTLAGITLTTPNIGTPSAGVLTSCTGLPMAGITSSTSANLVTLLSDEIGTGKLAFNHKTTVSIVNPNAVVTASAVIPIWNITDAAITITRIDVSTSSASYEAAGDLKWADARIGLGNAAVIETFDTSSGIRTDSSIASGAVAAGKFVYLSFDSAPSASMTDFVITITWNYS